MVLLALVTLLLELPTGTAISAPGGSGGPLPPSDLRAIEAPAALGAPSVLGPFHDPVPVASGSWVETTLTLAPRDPQGLANLASGGGTPLTASQVQKEFGPTPDSVSALHAWLEGNGLRVQAPPNGWIWEVNGTAEAFSKAFDTSLVSYSASPIPATKGGTAAADYAAPRHLAYTSPPRLPRDLPVASLASPDAAGSARPLLTDVGTSLSQGASSSRPSTTSSGCPNAELTPSTVQNAYNITPVLASGNGGQGERIGIVDAYDTQEKPWRIEQDLASFSSCYGLPTKNATIAWPMAGPSGLNNSTSSGWGVEIALDVQWAHATAPNASITLVLSPNNAYGLYYGVSWLVATQSVDAISLSWGEPESGVYDFGPCNFECNASSDGTFAAMAPVIQSAAAEGMNVFVASGDCGANGGTLQYAPWYPASDPHAIGVGGTALNLTSSGAYANETAWDGTSSFCLNGGGSGGGFSMLPRPGWQAGPGFSRFTNTTRGVPDVSLVAASQDPLGIIYQGGAQYVAGTSDAAPQWAGMDALLKGGASSPRAAGAGFLGPSLYGILRSSRYAADFHDVKTGWNGYTAGAGWDPLTGIGTPNFRQLYLDLTSGSSRGYGPPTPGTTLLSVEPQAGIAPLPVSFQMGALPTGRTASSYTFYYGDTAPPYQESNASTSVLNTSSYLYPADAAWNLSTPMNGTFTAFSTAFDTAGNTTMSLPVAINVDNGGPLEVAANATAGPAGGLTTITAVAARGIGPYRFSYFFGDGTYENSWTEDGPRIQHVYARNGSYLVGVVANDSSSTMRGGSTTLCVVVGGGPPACPSVPRTIVDDLVPTSPRLMGGGTTEVRIAATYNGLPVAGATVALAPRVGSVSPSVGTTGANGVLWANYTAPATNRTLVFGLFANASAPGYSVGLGEALLLVDPTTGPSLTPWVRFGQSPATAGSSEAVVIGGLKIYRGAFASNASVLVGISGGATGSLSGTMDPSGYFATTWQVPNSTSATDAVFTVTLSLPGFTAAPFRFLLPIVPRGVPQAAVASLTVSPSEVVSMGTVGVTVEVAPGSGGGPLPVQAANVTLSSEPYGVLSHWRATGANLFSGLFSTLITPAATGDILVVNVSSGATWSNGSTAALLEVKGGRGPLSLSFSPNPTVFAPGQSGNLTVRASSKIFGTPLTRVFMLVSPSIGNPSQAKGNSVFGWTNASGNLTFAYTAPDYEASVPVNVQAVGFVYNFTQTNFTLSVVPCCQGTNTTPPPPSSTPCGGGSTRCLGWNASALTEGVLVIAVVGLGVALAVVLLAYRRERAPPESPSLPRTAETARGSAPTGGARSETDHAGSPLGPAGR
ncbi:MAG: S8/S53 family peptidase [Euryarchaeota archaeon]|nr:S8/S53 family peptidase [Euryarchaeota archaeon]